MSENSYINYQNMVTDVTNSISRLDDVCRHLSMNAQADELKAMSNKLKNHIFSVGIMGEFKRGKSTVINALLGQKIVPQNVVPCSATLNYVRWDTEKRAEIHFKDGKVTQVSVDELENYVTKITKQAEETAANVDKAIVYFPCQFCQNGVQIVDTPGLNDDERMEQISEQVIPTLDAIIMVITAKSPFSMSEAEFVRNKVMTSDMGRIIFLVNQIDTIDEDERDQLLRHIKMKIQESVLEKTALVYGEDSVEYKATKDKIGSIRLLPVSALQALKGRTKNKPELYEESGYPEFEKALTVLLTEEKGLLELIHPINQLLSTGKEAKEIIGTRLNALKISSEEFEKVQKDSIKTIEDTRAKKKQEIKTLKGKGKTLYAELLPEVNAIYNEMLSRVEKTVTGMKISASDLADKASAQAFSERATKEIKSQLTDSISIGTERLQVRVQDRVGTDVKGLESFGKELNANLNNIRMNINDVAAKNGSEGSNSTFKDMLVDTGAIFGMTMLTGGFIPGVGGIISGYRDHGLKGAVVGGVSGAATGLLTFGLLATIVPGIGLPLALLATGAASAFGGKGITGLIFGKGGNRSNDMTKAIEQTRTSMLQSARQNVNELRSNQKLERWLKDTCENVYSGVASNIDEEWENSLKTMEDTLTQIKIDLQMNEETKKKTEESMGEYIRVIDEVADVLQPIYSKLSTALND